MKINLLKNDGTTGTLVELRQVPLKDLHLLLGDLEEDAVACLFLKPEGRTPEEVREVFEGLDGESQLEVFEKGWELNEPGLEKFVELQKKRKGLRKQLGGIDEEALMERLMSGNLEELIALGQKTQGSTESPGLSVVDTDSGKSSTNTPSGSSSS